ncbi:N5-carboxyaminoimidazole ribonucleotide mutase [Oceaniferula spumae]|uniref:N5-carboxyaminoimidazole ribonucleotide mutase n=2 Tax=Oceaniferula spumae TaxID=2979115 RepID=A0AAT9FGW9_9BACT
MKVIMIYGSANDVPFMEPAREYLKDAGVTYEETVLSAHRNLSELIEYLGKLEEKGEKAVILAIAGLAAALPGVVVMKTSLPVIGVPVPGGPLNGIDALLSISQLPGGVPATTVGLHKKAPANAAMAAHRILQLAGA